MDTLKKILHKDSSVHNTDDTTDTVATQQHEDATGTTTTTTTDHQFPHQAEQKRLNQEAGFDTTDTSKPQPRAGHHHPRQPVGATGLPPNHKPREHFAQQEQEQQQEQVGAPSGGGGGVGSSSAGEGEGVVDRQELVNIGKQVAESGNNFPGTNPHPAHSALGNESLTGERGTVLPGRE